MRDLRAHEADLDAAIARQVGDELGPTAAETLEHRFDDALVASTPRGS
jgi:hypothetical protein